MNYVDEAKQIPQNRNLLVVTIGIVVVSILLGFLFGFLAGYYGPGDDPSSSDTLIQLLTREADDGISQRLMNEIKADNIGEHFRHLTSRTHMAGTENDFDTAEELRQLWLLYGFESYVIPYDVLLSYPQSMQNSTLRNIVQLRNNSNDVIYESTPSEDMSAYPDDIKNNTVPHFNAYSPSGLVQGEPVYVNYAREEDFAYLNTNGIDLVGKICISRYGMIFRGDKANLAEINGCAALLLYSDPYEVAPYGGPYYPDSLWLPPTGVQRGTVKTPGTAFGDPLTPGYASIESAFRRDQSSATEIPTIIVQPIGYGDAQIFMANLAGPLAPAGWIGALPITYRIGPGYDPTYVFNGTVLMEIFNTNEIRTIHNAFGIIRGEIEPDRYVLMGNHRDAWVVGAADPTSGTASMMEVSRAMGVLVSQGWHPRRTIIFCSWGGEEHGLIGSTEWSEEYRKLLSERSVAYFNLDTAVNGNLSLSAGGVPLLYDFLFRATQKIPNPNEDEIAEGRATVYDTWKHYYPDSTYPNRPRMNNLGAGSDHAALIGKLGIPALDIGFNSVHHGNPLYHTAYDSYHSMELIDPDFVFHEAAARVAAEVVRDLADTYLLPFDTNEYYLALLRYVEDVNTLYGADIKANIANGEQKLYYLGNATLYFGSESTYFQNYLNSINKQNPITVRAVNDQIIQLERVFIDPFGLPDRADIRHLVYAPSTFDSYSGVNFPGIVDTMYIARRDNTPDAWNAVANQLAALTYTIGAAGTSLHDVVNFMLSSSVEARKVHK